MRIGFRVAIGMGMLVLLIFCVCARSAQQGSAPSPPLSGAQPKSDSTATTAPTKPGAAVLPPAAASRKAWKCLQNGLEEKNYDRRAQVIASLGTIGLRRDVVSLIEGGLNDKDAPVRQAAVDVLGTLKSRGSMPKLQLALDDKSAVVSFAAAQALWTMGDGSGQDLFLEVLDGDRKVPAGLVRGGLQQVQAGIMIEQMLDASGAGLFPPHS
jgi:HEAT repeat protein